MKILALIALIGCTQKYTSYDLIRKTTFNKESYERPITAMQIISQGRDQLKSCFNQWFFFSNAEKNKNDAIPFMIKSLCPGKDYLLESEMVETWWTTIFFSRSCIDVETICGEPKRTEIK